MAPKTQGGRIFCILYGLCGIPLCLVWISELGSFFGDRAKRLSGVLIHRRVSVVRPNVGGSGWRNIVLKRGYRYRSRDLSFRKRSSLPAQPCSCYGGFWCICSFLHSCSCLWRNGATWKASTSHSLHSQQ